MLSPLERECLRADGYIYLARVLCGPEQVQRWADVLRQWRPPRTLLRVHLEHNDLDEDHAAQILNAINGAVQAVYLHHNRIQSVRAFTPFLVNQSRTLLELHLSHNQLCTLEAEALLLQIELRAAISADDTFVSTFSWIRLEFNCIDVEKLMQRLPRSIKRRLQLDNHGCTPTRCNCPNRQYRRHIHAKFLALQYTAMPDAQNSRQQ